MEHDPNRKPGFYWIRFEGAPLVAEYQVMDRNAITQNRDADLGCEACSYGAANILPRCPDCGLAYDPMRVTRTENMVAWWLVPGVEEPYVDKKICEVLGGPLLLPADWINQFATPHL